MTSTSSLVGGIVVLGAVALAVANPPLGFGGADPSTAGASSHPSEGAASRRLDPDLRDALRAARAEAEADGVVLHVNSGWRSRAHQARLFRDAVDVYGSEEEAARWVATPDTSVHVSGDAIDVGPASAADWLAEHGRDVGLCRVYVNEPWHFELFADAPDDGCPRMYLDPTEDPRMQ